MKKVYKDLLTHMEASRDAGRDVEAAWYAYAVLEDRLRSMLRQSGGEGKKKGIGKLLRMMGPKLNELSKQTKKDNLLKNCFEQDRLTSWKDDRNSLVHAMADGRHDISQIDYIAAMLAGEGVELARLYAKGARRLKKHGEQVASPSL